MDTTDTPPLRSEKILVVDDNPINQKMTCTALRELGFEPEVAINGQEAVIKGKTGDYDLILMDLHMPILGGIESTRQIRKLEAARGFRTPIIAMTALSKSDYRSSVFEAGMDGYLEKPFELHQLKHLLKKHLNSSSEEEGSEEKQYYFAEVFDRDHLRERCMGDERMASQMVRSFLREAPDYLEKLDAALADGDWERCSYLLYKLRGAAGNICAGEIFHYTAELTGAIHRRDTAAFTRGLDELRSLLERFESRAAQPDASSD
jgi:CheY-like chemotaxis protein